jgi:hypothetical protein
MEMARLYGFGRDGRFEKVRVWRVARGGRGKEREARDGGRGGGVAFRRHCRQVGLLLSGPTFFCMFPFFST